MKMTESDGEFGDGRYARRQLLAQLLAQTTGATEVQTVTRVAPGQRVPLSTSQAPLWFMCNLYERSPEYNTYGVLDFRRDVPEAQLLGAVRTIVERHDALRLHITVQDEVPYQSVCDDVTAHVTWHDLTALGEEEAVTAAVALGSARVATPLPLNRVPLFRIEAIRLPAAETLVILIIHHIVSDGWAMGILLGELDALLTGKALGPAPTCRFIDDVAWQHANIDVERQRRQLDYWRLKLGGELPVLDFPKDRSRPAQPSRSGHTVPCMVPLPVISRAKSLAKGRGTTLFVVLLAAYKSLLWRLTRQPDVIVGTPFARRERVELEGVVGCFVNPVALRTDLSGADTFAEVLRRVQQTHEEAQDNQEVPFERVVSELRVPRELQYNPVFQTMFALQNTPGDFLDGQISGMRNWVFDFGTAKFDFVFSLFETRAGGSGFVEYAADLFDAATMERLVSMYVSLLDAMVNEPDVPLRKHALVPPDLRRHILELNAYERPSHEYRTMAQPFEEQVRRTPEAVALVGDEGTLTYCALNEQANRLAHYLLSLGVGSGDFVAVCMERSFALIVALYAIAKSGAAYVPLEPELPDARITYMLADAAPSVVFVDRDSRSRIPAGEWQVIDADADATCWATHSTDDLACNAPPDRPIHLLYTSGSTGRPKAVVYPIEGAIANVFWLQRTYPFSAGEANIFKTSYGFDVSIWEIFWPLYVGARLVICRPHGHRDPRYLIELIDRHNVTFIFMIPSLMQAVLDELKPLELRRLRWALCGGEPVTPRLRDVFHEKMSATLINGYGPTEAGSVTDIVVPREPSAPVVPLGRPASNFRLYVLDDEQDIVPIGVPGEAYIGGEVGLAHGYHRNPALTAERFQPDPYGVPGSRMYQTGDLCRYRPDGVLEHLGRIGTQVKIRGMRVELAEVESVLSEDSGVADCATVATTDAASHKIIAFIVPQSPGAVRPAELLASVATLLPGYMLPADVVLVDNIPTTVNGKIDRRGLIELWRERGGSLPREIVQPDGEHELRLKRVFESVLEYGEVGVTESFFDLGGHSLLVFKLMGACEAEFGYRPRVADIFAAPTVRALWPRILAAEASAFANLVPLAPGPGLPVVVCVHAASGSAMPFAALARELAGEYAVYALQSSGIEDDNATLHASIAQMANAYLAQVETVCGNRPLILVGWSMGGCVAMEMARQLRERNDGVAAMVMLDTWLPPRLRETEQAALRARDAILAMDVLPPGDLVRDGLLADTEIPVDGALDGLRRLQRAAGHNRRLFLDYLPTFYDGLIDFVRAGQELTDDELNCDEVHAASDRGWSPYVGELSVTTAIGDHFTLLASEHVASLAATLRNIVSARLTFFVI